MTKNKRLDDHFPLGDSYLMHIVTDAVGNYLARSIDSSALGNIKGTVTADGNYSVHMTDADGHRNEAVDGAVKTKAKTKTSTTAGHHDSGVGGGKRKTKQKGEHEEDNGSKTKATNGTEAKTTAQSAKTFAQGGNGPQRVQGDYSLSSEEGGLHFEAAKDYTISAKSTVSLASDSGEVSVNAKGGNIGVTAQAGIITLNSDVQIVFMCGSSRIIMQPGSITMYADKIDLNP